MAVLISTFDVLESTLTVLLGFAMVRFFAFDGVGRFLGEAATFEVAGLRFVGTFLTVLVPVFAAPKSLLLLPRS